MKKNTQALLLAIAAVLSRSTVATAFKVALTYLTHFEMLLIASIPVFGISIPNLNGLLAGMYVGGFEMAIPFICFGIAMRITSNPALINQLCYLSPFLSLFFIAMVLQEPIVITTYIGLVLIVAGIVFNEYFVKKPQASSPKGPLSIDVGILLNGNILSFQPRNGKNDCLIYPKGKYI